MSEVATLDGNQERIDRIIWRAIGTKSVRTIADETGLSVDEVLKRKNELRDEIDVLSLQEKRQKLLIDLDELYRGLMDKLDSTSEEFLAGTANAATAAMKVILAELTRLEKADTSAVDALNQKRVRELLRLIDAVVVLSVSEIAEKHSLDEDELMDTFNHHLREESLRLDSL